MQRLVTNRKRIDNFSDVTLETLQTAEVNDEWSFGKVIESYILRSVQYCR